MEISNKFDRCDNINLFYIQILLYRRTNQFPKEIYLEGEKVFEESQSLKNKKYYVDII